MFYFFALLLVAGLVVVYYSHGSTIGCAILGYLVLLRLYCNYRFDYGGWSREWLRLL